MSAAMPAVPAAAAAAPAAPPPGLRLHGVDHAWGPRLAVQGVSLYLPPGRCMALLGPSGCGKTTLLRLCAGLEPLQTGRIDNGFAHSVMLFQQPRLLPWKRIEDNIALGLKARGLPRAQRLQAARQMGAALGLDALALAQYPHQLSGGMQSRAALARALVLAPELLLLDEPFAALDIGLKTQMHRLLLAERARRPLAVLMITHDVMEAVALADSVLVMAGQPGRVCWRLDLPLPAAQRSEAWVHRQSAVLLAQPAVRAAFGLPAPAQAGPGDAAASGELGDDASLFSTGQAVAAPPPERQGC